MKVGEALNLNFYDDLRSSLYFIFYAAEFIGCMMARFVMLHRLLYDDQATSIFGIHYSSG